ncbi:MAG: FKBP-type peptidyl-prolyl cis-trans isomerase [Euryhalocaulis sp.]|uniref:FKBP-type peptidyl-prolyl cis-trans isomerase n=1 Tax=Euryhalocaulis sp. TaxID=2744307 RepID=UPI0017CAC7FC|nr:FKBP-type peptidyl-prolyl cis-trans isomerase [Euryhalocaulis sp.]MBA4801808.1 FKBP-type peptidyl-prolyl cis-trans isomerase [Euryhalocaulis sp.]
MRIALSLSAAAVAALLTAACGQQDADTDAAAQDVAPAETEMADAGSDTPEADGGEADAGPVDLAPEQGETEADENLQEAEAWLAENAERDEVQVTESGLQYEVLEAGPEDGESPSPFDWVCAHYTGELVDGTVFDSSREGGRKPLAYPAAGFIPAWIEALSMMKPGDRWKLYAHPELAYGPEGAGGVIPPNAALVFDMELLGVLNGDDVPRNDQGQPDPDYNCAETL